jgi:micrococcal nuclease
LHETRRTPRALRWSALVIFAFVAAISIAHAEETARVLWAHDGDTLRLFDQRDVRLIGINAPEIGRDGKPDEPLAVAARDRVSQLVRGRRVQLRYDNERFDRHGRTLAYVFLSDGRDLQEILLREGLAWFVAIAPNVVHRDRYRAAEAEARAGHHGIWSLPDYDPVPAERLTRRDTGFRRIVGTVMRVEEHQGWAMLRLAQHVELTIPRGVNGPAPTSLAGRRIVARGWLTAYKKNSLRMRITDPTMLETLP